MLKDTILFLSVIGPLYFIQLCAQDTLNLGEIIIHDKRLSGTWKEAARPVQVIQSSEIQSTPANSFEELLSYTAGLDVQQKGVHGIQADLSIRGGTFEQALILVNGIRMNDIQTGHHNFNIPLSPHAVDRIEIVKGPAARRYGQNAYAGAINIVTRQPDEDHLSVQTSYGDFGTLTLGAVGGFAGEKTNHLVQVNYAASDGYRYNTDYRKSNIWYQNSTKTSYGKFLVQGGFTKKDFGANGFYASPEFQDQYEEVETSLLAVETNILKKKWTVNPRIYWRRNQDMYLFVRDNPELFRNLHISNQVGTEINAQYTDKLGGTGFGAELRREFLSSNNLGDRSRTVASLFFEKTLDLLEGNLHLTPGFTWSDFSDFGSFFFPGVDIGFDLTQSSTLFANIGKTYRVPSFTDLYYMDRANLGNPDLVPEEALSYELGFRRIHAKSNLTISLFRRETENLIDWTKESQDQAWQPFNISELNTNGMELQYEKWFDHPVILSSKVGYTYIDNRLIGNSAPFSRYALENLRHQLVLNLKHKVGSEKLTHHLIYRYTDRINLEAYHLLDSRLEYSLPQWQFFVTVNNLLNTEYRESNLVPMPGRWFRIGVNYQMDF